MNWVLLVDLLISLIEKVSELLVEWRQRSGEGNVEGVGRLIDRVEAILKRQMDRTDLDDLTPSQANSERRNAALDEMKAVGINLRERDRRALLEQALIRMELKSQ